MRLSLPLGLLLISPLYACAGPTAERPAPTPRSLPTPSRSVPVTEPPPAVATTVRADGCTYDARNLEVIIDPGEGEPAFPLRVEEALMGVTEGGESLTVDVRGVLAFSGAVDTHRLRLSSPWSLDGFGVLPVGTPASRVVQNGPGVDVEITLAWSREAPGASPFSMSPSHEWFGTTLILPSTPCDALSALIEDRPARVEATDAGVVFGPSETTLRASRDESAPSLVLRGESGVPLVVRARSGRWSRVALRTHLDVTIEGWVPSASLRRASGAPRAGSLIGALGPQFEPPGTRRAATIRVGARVFVAPGRGAWATVMQGGDAEIAAEPNAEWCALVRINAFEIGPIYPPPRYEPRHPAWIRCADASAAHP